MPPFGQQGICFAGGDPFGGLRVAVSCGHESTQISTTHLCSLSTSSIKGRAGQVQEFKRKVFIAASPEQGTSLVMIRKVALAH